MTTVAYIELITIDPVVALYVSMCIFQDIISKYCVISALLLLSILFLHLCIYLLL